MSLASTTVTEHAPTRPIEQAGARRGRLHVVPEPAPEPPPLRLRALPHASPEPWHPGHGTAGDGHDGAPAGVGPGRTGATGTVGAPGSLRRGGPAAPGARPAPHEPDPGQRAFVLHGLPVVTVGPDPDPSDTVDVADLPCPEQLARRLVQAAVDVVRGHRPASQVLRWTTPEVYSQLRQRARLEQAAGRAGGRRPVVRSLRTSRSGERGVEVSAVVLDGNRARAVAARLDGEESRWRLTALVIG